MPSSLLLLRLSVLLGLVRGRIWQACNPHTSFCVCSGTSDGSTVAGSTLNAMTRLRAIYTNCTTVDGNLEIVGLNSDSYNLSDPNALDFLGSIKEVYGYVHISKNAVPRISLPSLEIIWNRQGGFKATPEEYNAPATRDIGYGLVIENNIQLHTVDMRRLRVVKEGGVYVAFNRRLCHINTINWTQIIDPDDPLRLERGECDPESERCAKECRGHCWGKERDECQDLYRAGCAPQCINSGCFKPGSLTYCCHHTCIGGCTGPLNTDCTACENFENEGTCVISCPALKLYDEFRMTYRENPLGRYTYKKKCLEKCPSTMLIHDGACVAECPDKYYVPTELIHNSEDGPFQCIPCEKACEKTCQIKGPITSLNIDELVNCTLVTGFIELLGVYFQQSASTIENGKIKLIPQLNESDLQKLSQIETVTNYVHIQDMPMTNLSFLSNLKEILGRHPFQGRWALEISGNEYLDHLGLKSLKKVTGEVFIGGNNDLCFEHNIPWEEIVDKNFQKKGENRDERLCERDGRMCDEECDPSKSCWGPGDELCYACKHFELEGRCVPDCPTRGFYRPEPHICARCHSECLECSDSTPLNCSKCLNVELDGECVASCPLSHYPDGSHCVKCNRDCVNEGCSGAENFLGPGGCNKCLHALLDSHLNVERCLRDTVNDNDICEQDGLQGYFRRSVKPSETLLRTQVKIYVCEKCHPACKSCHAFGTRRSSRSDHCECSEFEVGEKEGGECRLDCPPEDFYVEREKSWKRPGICTPCDPNCKDGCTGPLSTHCNSCHTYVDFYDPDDPEKINCTEICPEDRPYTDQFHCTNKDPLALQAIQQQKQGLLIGGIVGGCLIAMIAISVICFCQRKKASRALDKILLPPQYPLDGSGLNPNAKPNMARLRIIKETEIRRGGLIGEGAFGLVFRGVYIPEEAHPQVKIPVAIKEVGSKRFEEADTAEMLEEASIMAAMDHRHLVRLVGVCVSGKIMLLTPLMPLGNLLDYVHNNKANIGSYALLTWATQIAEGMEYLEAQHLVHRDLAARNVLVQLPYHVRVADFGLAKMLEFGETEVHVDGRVPLKWLAIESIEKQVFTHKSDVWAFGVTVWELLKFGAKPYPDIPMNQMKIKLQAGHRLPQPDICSVDLYLILIRCWLVNADARPNFKQLRELFENMLKDPPKFLSVPNDKLIRMPSTASQEEQDQLDRWRADFKDLIEIDGEVSQDYFDGSTPPSPHKPLIGGRPRGSRHTSVGSHRYQSDPLKHLPPHQEFPDGESEAEPPTDGDNYLIPDSQKPTTSSSSTPQHLNYTPVLTNNNMSTGPEYYNKSPSSGLENLEYLQPKLHSQTPKPRGRPPPTEFVQNETAL